MKTKTPISLLALCLLYSGHCFSQSSLYSQSNKETEYNYGVIADQDLATVSEIEKIKYEFRYQERTCIKTIDPNYQTTLDITVDSNGYEEPWMNLAKRFHYDVNGISYYDKQNVLMNTIAYTNEQKARNVELAEQTRESGYHPGLEALPEINGQDKADLESQGYLVQTNTDATITTLVYPSGEKEIFNTQFSSISHEWIDEDGLKNIETRAYEPFGDHKGFLLKLYKREKFLQSENGPCITEVTLIYYSNYKIEDHAGLIDKATDTDRSIMVYPNPNNGIFSVAVTLQENEVITGALISNSITGEIIDVNADHATNFAVDMRTKPSANYVIQIVTNQTTLSTHFFKQ
jgi:hypothetical protein